MALVRRCKVGCPRIMLVEGTQKLCKPPFPHESAMPLKPIHSLMVLSMVCVFTALSSRCSARGNAFLEPAIHHTNGMRVASSEAQRCPSVNWSCNPDHLGYCSGYYFRPCLDSLRVNRIAGAREGCYSLHNGPYSTSIHQVCPEYEPAGQFDGIEATGATLLGNIPNDMLGPGLGPGQPGRQPGGAIPFGQR